MSALYCVLCIIQVAALIQNGVDVNIMNDWFLAPRHLATDGVEVMYYTILYDSQVAALIQKGVDVNIMNEWFLAPLHLATGGVEVMYSGYSCRADITEILLRVTIQLDAKVSTKILC